MRGDHGTEKELLAELAQLRRRVAELEEEAGRHRAAAEKYRSIFDNAVEGIFQTTPQGRFLTMNPAIAHIMGYRTPEEAIAAVSDIQHQLYVDPEDRTRFRRLLEEQGEVREFETRMYRADRSVIWLSLSAQAVRDREGKVAYYEGTIEDITRRKQREREVAAIAAIGTAIAASLDLRLTLNVLLEQVTTLLRADAAAVLLLNPYSQTLEYAAGRGFRGTAAAGTRLRMGEGAAGRAACERRIVAIPALSFDAVAAELLRPFADEGFTAYHAVPFVVKGVVKGVLEIFHRAPFAPDREWLNFLEALAGQAAIAIDNAELFDNLQRTNRELILAYDATIEGWSRALDLRDKKTEGHSLRVTEIALRLARALGMREEEIVQVRRGSLLHDIGKMGIPDRILHKPGPLTAEERAVMDRHPRYAYDMLYPIPFLRPALDIPYCHHEKWDGTGYPRNLKGEQIPLMARVFAVVDVWDALCSDRSYRAGMPEEEVRDHLRAEAGRHFDPEVVEAFLRLEL
ncbi:MAG TPA: HD domain-containing phosphohydrolase [Geobacteraceae bacterium]